jgi:hypothetical protein
MTAPDPTDFSTQIQATKKLREASLLRAQTHQLDIIQRLTKIITPLTIQQQHQLTTAQDTYDHLLKKDQDQHE